MGYIDLDLDAFVSWLCEHEHEEVGHPGRWFETPLAMWLSWISGQTYGVSASAYGRASCDEDLWFPLPRWAMRFVTRLECVVQRPITGAEAFRVLAQVERTLGS